MQSPAPASPATPARVATSAAFGVQGLVFAALLTRLPALKDKLDFTDGQLAALLAVVPVIAGAGSVLADRLAARHGSARVLRASVVCACLAAALVAVSGGRLAIYLALAGYGLSVGAVDATMNMQGVAVQARYGRTIMNGFHAVYSTAAILGALYTAAVASWLPVEVSTIVVASVGAATMLLATRWLALPAGDAAVGSGAGGSGAGGSGAGGSGAGGATPGAGGADLAASAAGAVPGAMVPWRLLMPVGIVLGCVYVADAGVSNWSAVYLHDTLHSAEGVAALAFGAYQAAALLGRMFGDRLVGRHGPVPVVRTALVVAAAGLLLVITAGSPPLAIAGFAVAGLGASVLVPLSFSAAGRLDAGRGTAVARVNLFNYAGFLVGAPLVGTVGAVAGMRLGWLAPTILLVAMLLLATRLDPAPRPAVPAPAAPLPPQPRR